MLQTSSLTPQISSTSSSSHRLSLGTEQLHLDFTSNSTQNPHKKLKGSGYTEAVAAQGPSRCTQGNSLRSDQLSHDKTGQCSSAELNEKVCGYLESESSSDMRTQSFSFNSSRRGNHVASSISTFLTQTEVFLDMEKMKLENKSEPEIVQASRNGDIPAIKRLICQYCDMDETDSSQRTALHVASCLGRVEVVKLLVQSGADVDVCSVAGKTPLHEACTCGRFDVVQVLMGVVADLDKGDINGLSAAHHCALNGETECLYLLFKQVNQTTSM